VSLSVEGDGLVTRVKAGHVTLSAIHAEIIVDDWELLFFGHVVDVLEIVATCASDLFQGRHLFDVYFSWFFSLLPEFKVVDKLFQGLTLLSRWTLTFPSLLPQIISLHQIECSFQAIVQILNDAEILFLDCRCDLENRASTELSISQCMMSCNDTSGGHKFCAFQVRVIS
jgi:hypothetical protein